MSSLDRAPAFRLHRLQRLLRVHLLGILSPVEITPEQYFVLMRLADSDGLAQGALGDPALDDRGSVSRQVAGLERRGLVVRRPNPNDGRVLSVHLTAGGRRLLDELVAVVAPERERLFGDLDAADLAALHRIIDHLEARLT